MPVLLMMALAACGGDDDDGRPGTGFTATPTVVAGTPPPATVTPTPTCPVTPPPDALGQYGSIVEVAQSVIAPVTLPPYALESGSPGPLPSRVVLTNLPAIAMQGTPDALGFPGSCEAQSFAYGLGSYTAARNADGTVKWNAAEAQNEISAAFLFAWAQAEGLSTCGTGEALPYLRRLITTGAPSVADVPYQPYCCYFDEIDPTLSFPDQERFRIGSFTSFKVGTDVLDLMKYLLASGHPIAFSGPVFEGYPNPTLSSGVFGSNTGLQPLLIPDSGHGQLVVGYDDGMGDPSAPGAFLIQNSFGEAWPPAAPGGRIWWAYQTFLVSQILAAVAYPLELAPPTGLELQSTLAGVEAYVTQVNHWVMPTDPAKVYLIVQLRFGAPVVIDGVTLVEPESGTTVTQSIQEPMANGYVFIERQDGAQFRNGDWNLAIAVTDPDGATGQLSGSIALGPSVPTTPAQAPVAAPILGTNGQPAIVTAGP